MEVSPVVIHMRQVWLIKVMITVSVVVKLCKTSVYYIVIGNSFSSNINNRKYIT